jgi:YidC/Oxa1 family membrane protein insertase
MERSSLLRWVLIGAAVFLLIQFGLPALTGKKSGGPSELQPLGARDDLAAPAAERKAEELCKLTGKRFVAELSTKGGSLRRVLMADPEYTRDAGGKGPPIDLVTTKVESRMPLRTDLRSPEGPQQIAYDDLDFTLAAQDGKSCTFQYSDAEVALSKVVRSNDRPFELELELSVTNRAAEPRRHRLSVEQTDWRTRAEMAGSMGRVSEFQSQTVLRAGQETKRLTADDFEPSDFKDKDFTAERWRRAPGDGHWAAVSSSYFSKALFHVEGPAAPFAESVIEEYWDTARFAAKSDDPSYGDLFRARLAYPVQELAPGASSRYRLLGYVGPKERDVLARVGGSGHDASELLELGVFGWIGKVLIQYLYWLFQLVGTWGWAICLLTITVRTLLFPLSLAQIKSSMAMRQLKPQMDELNAKYKDDPQQKSLALQELFRKNKVTNPVLGCIPVLLQMPVWFALYQALNTAVELYHVPFGPVIPDLSAPGKYFIIPIVLGMSSFFQQKLMPMQGDPMQQKMMLYMMPAIFTVFMLFLPAGLGIYFLTNTWLGIGQQLAVERYYKSRSAAAPPTEATDDKAATDDKPSSRARGKERSRVQQGG